MRTSAQQPLSPSEARRWTEIGVLSALALLLGYLESFVPIPIPGVKLGLANIPILVCLARGDLWGAFFVGLVKVAATSLLFGNPLTLAYALTGTLLAFALMAPLSRLRTMRLEMVSVVGALAHEAGQLLVAQALLGTPLVWYGAPLLGVAGVATGLLCGILATRLTGMLEGLDVPSASGGVPAGTPVPHDPQPSRRQPAALVFAGYAVLVVAAMHAHSPVPLASCLATSLVACLAARTTPGTAARALAPTLPIALVATIAQVASAAQGTVLASVGPVDITREALVSIAVMLARLASVTLASVALVGLVGRGGISALAQLPAGPLRALGFDTRGPELALSTTLALIPALSQVLANEVGPHDLVARAFWQEQFPALMQGLYAEALSIAGSSAGAQ